MRALFDRPGYFSSPQNVWPDDRSWVLYTDSNAWATLISGSTDLIEDILHCPDLKLSGCLTSIEPTRTLRPLVAALSATALSCRAPTTLPIKRYYFSLSEKISRRFAICAQG